MATNFAVTGVVVSGTTGVPGQVPVRQEIRMLQSSYPDQWNLYLLGLNALQNVDEEQLLSYYQIAGIHGMPYKPWDGVAGVDDVQQGLGGYCTHSSVLFAPWHRPYLALFEMALYNAVQAIATEFPAALQPKYVAAAEVFRIPYWDWASTLTPTFPTSISSPTATVVWTDGTTKSIRNPLYSYKFNPVNPSPDDFDSFWSQFSQTLRYPKSSSQSQDNLVAQAMANDNHSLRQNVNILLTSPSYSTFDAFSNNAWDPNVQGGAFGSLEDVHNEIHDKTGGGNGHMGSLDVSAFDPVFWLHHTNVDRLFAIWQALNPDSYVTPQQSEGNFSTEPGTTETVTSPLKPFWDASGTDFWTSANVQDTTGFGYAYPETQKWLFASDAVYQQTVRQYINVWYGPGAVSPSPPKPLAPAAQRVAAQTSAASADDVDSLPNFSRKAVVQAPHEAETPAPAEVQATPAAQPLKDVSAAGEAEKDVPASEPAAKDEPASDAGARDEPAPKDEPASVAAAKDAPASVPAAEHIPAGGQSAEDAPVSVPVVKGDAPKSDESAEKDMPENVPVAKDIPPGGQPAEGEAASVPAVKDDVPKSDPTAGNDVPKGPTAAKDEPMSAPGAKDDSTGQDQAKNEHTSAPATEDAPTGAPTAEKDVPENAPAAKDEPTASPDVNDAPAGEPAAKDEPASITVPDVKDVKNESTSAPATEDAPANVPAAKGEPASDAAGEQSAPESVPAAADDPASGQDAKDVPPGEPAKDEPASASAAEVVPTSGAAGEKGAPESGPDAGAEPASGQDTKEAVPAGEKPAEDVSTGEHPAKDEPASEQPKDESASEEPKDEPASEQPKDEPTGAEAKNLPIVGQPAKDAAAPTSEAPAHEAAAVAPAVVAAAPAAVAAAATPAATTATKQPTTEWITNVRVVKHSLDQTFRILVFVGEPAADTPGNELPFAPTLAGRVTVLGRGRSNGTCAKCAARRDLVVSGTVPLTHDLRQAVADGQLASLNEADVVPYLKEKLVWRVTLFGGEEKPAGEVEGLVVSVVSTTVTVAQDGTPVYSGEYATHPECTEGKPAGYAPAA